MSDDYDRSFELSRNAEGRAQHRAHNSGIDCSVLWLTRKNVMERAGVSSSQLQHALHAGKITASRPGRGKLVTLFHPNEVARYVAERNKEKEKC